jgi:heme O synthase-like polyprenyltransferase
LVKARLTLLVLLTTAVGFYLGAERPIDYIALFHVVLGTAAAAAGAGALQPMVGTETRCLDASNEATTRFRPAACVPWKLFALGVVLSIFGIGYLAIACKRLSACPRGNNDRDLHFRLYAAETHEHGKHPPWGRSQARSRRWSVGQQLVERSIPAHGAFCILFLCNLPHFFAIA